MMMEGLRVGGRVGVGVGVEDDMGDGMQCSDHPYRNNPGGICAFCLQEKLGKLVSSSFPLPIRVSSSSSSSPSFRSDTGNVTSSGFTSNGVVHTSSSSSSSNPLSLSLSVKPTSSNVGLYQEYYTRKARIPFLLAKKKKKVMATASSSSSDHHHRAADVVFKRSKSTATPIRGHYLDDGADFSPRKRSGFWSFLYLSSSKPQSGSSRRMDKLSSLSSTSSTTSMSVGSAAAAASIKGKTLGSSSMSKKGAIVVVEEDDSPNSQTNASASFDRKVSRSRSVGCGSRSFSGDFFERISTGFGDCTLRRVESQREGKPKASGSGSAMKERVKCGGIFGGFIMTSSSSSSSSSSYWVSSSAEEVNGKAGGHLVPGRNRGWGWAFASPMRAFGSKPASKDGRRGTVIREASSKNSTSPNLSAIPSLLAVRS